MTKPKFSVVLIARNEEHTLPRLVNSLKEFQDRGGEICVLDTGSTDKTVEVATVLGCKVKAVGDKFKIKIDEELAKSINEKFIVEGEAPVVNDGESLFDFGSARNEAALMSSNEMIAMPDCDEIYTKIDIDKLDKLIEEGYEQFEYNFVFSHDELGNPVIKFRHSKFYDRRKMSWSGIIHEILGGPVKRIFLDEDVIKLEHYQNEKTNRSGYIKGLALDCYNHPESDRNSHYFAREMYYLGRTKSAIKEFKRHIAMDKWPTEASQSMLYIGDCYKRLGDTGEMLKWYSLSSDKEMRREPMMRIAEFYYGKGMHKQAIAYAEAALTVSQLPFYSNHQPYYEHAPHELLYVSYWQIGDKEKSKEHWKKAIKFMPGNPKYLSDAQFYKDEEPVVIPKEIYTFWFNENCEMPTLVKKCIDSQVLPGYKHNVITLDNLGELKELKYVKECLESEHLNKKWVKLTDYLRFYLAYHRGGIFLDADMEILSGKNFDSLLCNDIFVGKEKNGWVASSLLAARPKLDFIKKLLDEVETSFSGDDDKPFESSMEILDRNFQPEKLKDMKVMIMGHNFFQPYSHEDKTVEITGDTICYHHFMKSWVDEVVKKSEPKISFIIPTLGREAGLERCLESIKKLNYPEDKIEVIVEEDSFENRVGVPKLLKHGVEESTGEWVVYASNDTEFDPESINEALSVGGLGYVAFNTGEVSPDEGNINEHFMIRKDIIAKIGEIFDTDFNHVGVDNLLHAKMKKLGIFTRADKAIVKHFHFTRGSELDDVYKLAWNPESVKADRELLKVKLAEL